MRNIIFIKTQNSFLISSENKFLEFEGSKTDKEVLKFLEEKLSIEKDEIIIKNKRQLKYYNEDINVVFASLNGIEIENDKFRNFNSIIDNLDSLYIEIAYDYSLFYELREKHELRKNEVLKTQEKKTKQIDLMFAAIIGLIFGFSLFSSASGVNGVGIWTTFVSLLVSAYLLWFKKVNVKNIMGVVVLATGIILSITFSIFSNGMLRGINIFVVPIFILGGIRLTFMGDIEFVFLGFLRKMLYFTIISPLTNNQGIVVSKLFKSDKKKTEKTGLARDIIIGLVISVPVLLILGGMLVSASSGFEDLVIEMISALFNFNLTGLEYFLFGIITSVVVFGYMILFLNTTNVQFDGGTKSILESNGLELKLNIRILNTVLVMINVLYLAFVVSSLNQTVDTYSGVARQGFFKLIFVVVINIVIIMFFRTKTGNSKFSKVLYAIMTIFSLWMAGSSIKSLAIYIGGYGLTRLRFISIIFVGFLIILLGMLLVNIFMKFKMWNYTLIIAMVFYVAVNYINMDAYIVKYNVDKYAQSGQERYLDEYYAQSLSYDAKFEIADAVKKGYFNSSILDNFKAKDTQWFEYNYYECSQVK
ncbi:MAG: DUF4153 domain-containing protein [Sarcina sp.]